MTAAQLSLTCALTANPVGADPTGTILLDQLHTAGIQHRLTGRSSAPTPEITVIADLDTRTCFAHLARARADLENADLTLQGRARAADIDCYRAITPAAVRAITEAARADVPVILNLGGAPRIPTSHAPPRRPR